MLKIGEKIMYGANGVMMVDDIRDESVAGVSRSYYVLRPVLGSQQSLIFVPTDNENLTSIIRPLLTKEEMLEFVKGIKDIAPAQWINEGRARQDKYKKMLESGDREKIVSVIHAIEESARRREEEGKKRFVADEGIRLRAERLICSEISVVLGISDEEALSFISEEG